MNNFLDFPYWSQFTIGPKQLNNFFLQYLNHCVCVAENKGIRSRLVLKYEAIWLDFKILLPLVLALTWYYLYFSFWKFRVRTEPCKQLLTHGLQNMQKNIQPTKMIYTKKESLQISLRFYKYLHTILVQKVMIY